MITEETIKRAERNLYVKMGLARATNRELLRELVRRVFRR